MFLAESWIERNATLVNLIAGVLVALVSIVATRYYVGRDKARKTFDYRVVSDVQILSHRPDDSDLRVIYAGDELDNPRVVRVRFANSGTEVIRPADVLSDYVLSVSNGWLVSASLVDASAANLVEFVAAAASSNIGEVTMTLATLNPGDHFTLQLIVDGAAEADVSLTGRMEGETRGPGVLAAEDPNRGRRRTRFAWGAAFIALGLAFMYWAVAIKQPNVIILAVASFTAGIAIAGLAWMESVERRVRTSNGVMRLERDY